MNGKREGEGWGGEGRGQRVSLSCFWMFPFSSVPNCRVIKAERRWNKIIEDGWNWILRRFDNGNGRAWFVIHPRPSPSSSPSLGYFDWMGFEECASTWPATSRYVHLVPRSRQIWSQSAPPHDRFTCRFPTWMLLGCYLDATKTRRDDLLLALRWTEQPMRK